MSRAALFFDIDGTLTSNRTGKIQASGIEAIHRAQKKGNLVFINTGRTYCSVQQEIKNLGMDGFLCGCGTCVIFHDRVLMHHTIRDDLARRLVADMIDCDIDAVLEGHEDLFFSRDNTRFVDLEFMRKLYRNYGLSPVSAQNGYPEGRTFDKYFIVTDEQSDVLRYFDRIREDMEIIDRERGRYEIVPKGFSKSTAIEFVQKEFSVGLDDVYVFGDSANDLAMFRYARHTVALGAHSASLDPYTEYVTDDVEKDGIAHALEHYGLC